jgi:hypothetical protein
MRCFLFAILIGLLCGGLALSQEPKGEWTFIDLQPKANQELRETLSDNYPDTHLADLPQGEQKLGAAVYKIGPGCICLGSTLKTTKPDKVEIPVKRKMAKLFLLHATQYGGTPEGTPTHVKDGTLIGQYMVRYSDGSGEGIEIVYGEDVRDWWNWDKSKETKRGKIAWTGTNPTAKMFDCDVRLYESTWTNPKPDLEVESVTYSSRMDTPGAPFCVAITAVNRP